MSEETPRIRVIDRIIDMPRWIDALWAVFTIVAVVWTETHLDNKPFSAVSVAHGNAWLSFMLRAFLTFARISRGTSLLRPLVFRLGVALVALDAFINPPGKDRR